MLNYYGWYEENSQERSWPVAQRKPNAWGLFDMHGNALEWCLDWYFDDYPVDAQGLVTDGTDDRDGYEFELRGGTYRTPASFARSGWRDHQVPVFRSYEFGFRIARTIPAEKPDLLGQ
jgi:formylglycine-generating enzyme required for sulfatase activity